MTTGADDPGGAVRVLIVDDQALMRQGLRKLLEIEEGVEVVGDARDGLDALAWLVRAPSPPDVVLVDARMPRMDGVALVAELTERYEQVAVLMLTTFDDDEYIFGALRAGAKGFLLKDTPPEDLVAVIRRAANGETVLGGVAAERVVGSLRAPAGQAVAETPHALSERELEVARLVAQGASNREISRTLFITEGTAKNHISSSLRKLDLRDRTQLALWVNALTSTGRSVPEPGDR